RTVHGLVAPACSGEKLSALFRCAMALGAELTQQPHHVVIVPWRRRIAAENPVEQIGIGAFKQRFEPFELTSVEDREERLSERAENEVALLRPAIPAAELRPPAPEIEIVSLEAV